MSYKNKLVEIYVLLKFNYAIEKIVWEENLIMIHVENMKYITVKVPNDDSTEVYCLVADSNKNDIPTEKDYKIVNNYNELLASLIDIEKNMGIIQCPQCKTKIIM